MKTHSYHAQHAVTCLIHDHLHYKWRQLFSTIVKVDVPCVPNARLSDAVGSVGTGSYYVACGKTTAGSSVVAPFACHLWWIMSSRMITLDMNLAYISALRLEKIAFLMFKILPLFVVIRPL